MLFGTPVFLFLFLPLVLAASLVAPRALRNTVLLFASLLFYAWGETVLVLVMVVSILVNWVLGLWVARRSRPRVAVTLAVVFNLGLLGWFKYANFLAENLGLELEPIHLPIGISFFTFQALSYVVDIYRKDGPAQVNPINFGLYISLFPQLIAGPIVRYQHIARQLTERARSVPMFAEGARRFVIGLAKKMLIANTVAIAADEIFALPGASLTTPIAWLGLVCYTLQIYFDFSGYSDMAIGLGRMLGFHFLENFDYPYVSRSVTEFWRRWHISLSSWFRDYVYIPLGGNRGGPLATYRNLVLVFLLCGLWHGASWTFVIWGAYHGLFLVLERVGLRRLVECAPRPLRHVYALLVVMLGWVFFRAETFGGALAFLRAMAGASPAVDPALHLGLYLDAPTATAIAVGALGATPVLLAFGRWRRARGPVTRTALELASVVSLLLLLFGCAAFMASGTHNPFIYFRF